ASPEEVYNHPANMFVAGFIGSPAMNFIHGELVEEAGQVWFISENVKVLVPEGKAKLLREKGYVPKEVVFGIRPEDVHDEPVFIEASPNTVVHTHIDIAENLGHEMYLYLDNVGKSESFVARVDGRTGLKDQMDITVAFDMN